MRNFNILQQALILSAAAFSGQVDATPTVRVNAKVCNNYKIPVSITSTNLVFGLPFKNNLDVADFVTIAGSRDDAARAPVITGVNTTSRDFTIGATFCTPAKSAGSKKDIVLVATHGGLFDRTYWDPNLDKSKYSFVDWVIGQGYSIFYYDRIGQGESSVVSGYYAQLSNQAAVLTELTKLVKAGKYVGSVGKPKSVVLVGHSIGSNIAAQAVADDLTLADGLILTGYGFNQSIQNPKATFGAEDFRIAKGVKPLVWGKYDTGYLVPVDQYPIAATFFKKPNYDPAVVAYVEKTKQPFGIIEVLTSSIPNAPPAGYKGVAMILTGENDFIFCTSKCDQYGLEHPAVDAVFNQAKAFKATVWPGAGHGLNFAANAAGSFKEITDFLAANGL
ncbi:Alpha/Beta hydrolase protein [Rhypophila decipiens]|uniref:Alpha/Beta hydrolase protein n=1 Tax=Rhypophila decipiens TaxID=261697 RepID=A0AAN6XWG3_9PEZI|nr:Alpha/Beta hydrolase protein [Rhypophila decipiens]